MKGLTYLSVTLVLILFTFAACRVENNSETTTESETVYTSVTKTDIVTASTTLKQLDKSQAEQTTEKKADIAPAAKEEKTTTEKQEIDRSSNNGLVKREGLISGTIDRIQITFSSEEKVEKVTVFFLDGTNRSVNSIDNSEIFFWSNDGLSVAVNIGEYFPDATIDTATYVRVCIEGYNLVIDGHTWKSVP